MHFCLTVYNFYSIVMHAKHACVYLPCVCDFRSMAVPAPAPPSARMVNLCSAAQSIMAPNPMLQGALLMQQMQGKLMRPNIACTICVPAAQNQC